MTMLTIKKSLRSIICSASKATNAGQLVREIERGFEFGTLERVREATGLPLERLAISIGISPRTLTRRKKSRKIKGLGIGPPGLDFASFDCRPRIVRGRQSKDVRWFNAPNRALGEISPLAMAATGTGAREVENLIGRLEHGVFS